MVEKHGKKRIFIIHSLNFKDKERLHVHPLVSDYVKKLEANGRDVYFPFRDTPQNKSIPEILKANLKGIKWCDEAHVLWDGTSHGSLFDLGSAYALEKPIKVIYITKRTWYSHLVKFLGRYLK